MNPLDPIPPNFKQIDGIKKLQKLISKELEASSKSFNECKEKCSNLPHLLSIVKCIHSYETCHNPSAVLKPFAFSESRTGRLVVDIVSTDGTEWFKISARNPKSLSLLASGSGGFGRKTILDHAVEYLECSKENECLFRPPKITFIFTSGIGTELAEELEDLGVNVIGEKISEEKLDTHPRIIAYDDIPDNLNEDTSDISSSFFCDGKTIKNPSLASVNKLNLDISALLAYVSNLTNGHTDVQFETSVLAQQLEFEKLNPQKPVLDKIFSDRELICCETAMREFKSILGTVGGADEKERANAFLQRIRVVPDRMSERCKLLGPSGNIKKRSLIIFGTGDSEQAVTVTANAGFVRSAKTQGVDLQAYVHESRALTEQKELRCKMKKLGLKGADANNTNTTI